MNLLEIVIKRLLIAIPSLLLVSLISFTLMRYDFTLGPITVPNFTNGKTITLLKQMRIKNPVDPLAEMKNNPQISRSAILKEEKRLGLDRPFIEQYFLWLGNVLKFNPNALAQGNLLGFFQPDLGLSFNGEPVLKLIAQRLPATLLLNILSVLASWLIAIPLGVVAAVHWRSKLDNTLLILSSISMGMPTFVMALLMALLAVKTGLFPVGGLTSDGFDEMNLFEKTWDLFRHLFLPVTILTITSIASLQRQMRGNLLDVLGANYVRTARAKGLPENKVIYKHALRTAINPLITLLGFEFAGLFSGAALVEMILRYPGVGYLSLEAARQTDTNLVMTILILGASVLVIGNLIADILLRLVDPRLEHQVSAA